MKKAIPIVVFLLAALSVVSQKTITGIVTDASSGETLIGANVFLKSDPGLGTITDIDGSYTIDVPSEASTLVFSYTGYNTVEKEIPANNQINVAMTQGTQLEEIVVIGYGTVKREDATGSIASVTSEKFNKGAIAGPQQLLSGKVAGVNITTDGSPGGGADIRIRGESSLGASNDPLIVVDGIPLDNSGASGSRNALNLINPADIESMTVLKDASATAIYGNRASAGVILITTKKGKLGGINVSYNASVNTGSIVDQISILDADEFRAAANNLIDTSNSTLALLDPNVSTNWQDEIFQNSTGTDHNLSISGGIGDIPFRASLGYTNFNGILRTDNFNRTSANINLTPGFINNRLQLNVGLKASRTNNRFADRGAIGSALAFDPTKPVRVDDPQFDDFFAWKNPDGSLVGLAPSNPVALLEQKFDESTVNRYIASTSIDYRFGFLPNLRANLNMAYDYANGAGTTFVPENAAFAFIQGGTGSGSDNFYDETKTNSLLEFYLNYKKEILGNDFDIMAGYSWQKFSFDKDEEQKSIDSTITTGLRIDRGELYMLSLFSRVNYSLGDRVLLTGTLRQDQTSRFSPDTRSGLFPSAAVAVKLLENDNKYLNNMKLRVGWGKTGQQEIGGYYLWQGLYENSDISAQYQLGDSLITTTRPNGYDAGIRWETTSTFNAGVDFSLIKNRLGGSIDVYQRNTEDLLVSDVQTVVGSNLTNIITTNLGNMTSRGLEVSLNMTPILTPNSAWDININAAFNRNEITKLTNDSTSFGVLVGGISGGVGNNIQVHSVGFEPYSFFVFEQLYDEAGNLLPGEFADRNKDGVVNDGDKYRIEATRPDVVFGFTSNYNYKNFDFSVAARANLGRKVYNNVQTDFGWTDRISNNNILNNLHPVALELGAEGQNELLFSDHFIQDADFLRVDHITLGYTFNKLIGESLRVYTTVQNPFLFTPYDGIDPEIFNGIDNTIYPRARNFVFGFNVNF